ncbi:DUF2767 family protein [Pantoea dispersa]|uniref:DUF2767 family protein n=1 Tax=Pantoea dispersa TaxID=59814 RepID=UPI000F665171|nr:DUF2767 family protein [Pantoea dispersa]RRW66924.1 DUF2767 family protein [Pantoea dispersa]
MQKTEQQHQDSDSEEVYRMTGAVVLALADCGPETTRLSIAGYFREELAIPGKWSPGIMRAMQSVIDMLEILPDRDKVEFHRDEDGRVL